MQTPNKLVTLMDSSTLFRVTIIVYVPASGNLVGSPQVFGWNVYFFNLLIIEGIIAKKIMWYNGTKARPRRQSGLLKKIYSLKKHFRIEEKMC